MQEVARCPNEVFTSGLRIFQNTGRFKSADWLHLVTTGVFHVLKPMLIGSAQNALCARVDIFRLLLATTSDRDPLSDHSPLLERDIIRREEEMRALKSVIVQSMCAYEKGAPSINMTKIAHLLVHAPDLIFRWNSVRNMWCFFNERY